MAPIHVGVRTAAAKSINVDRFEAENRKEVDHFFDTGIAELFTLFGITLDYSAASAHSEVAPVIRTCVLAPRMVSSRAVVDFRRKPSPRKIVFCYTEIRRGSSCLSGKQVAYQKNALLLFDEEKRFPLIHVALTKSLHGGSSLPTTLVLNPTRLAIVAREPGIVAPVRSVRHDVSADSRGT